MDNISVLSSIDKKIHDILNIDSTTSNDDFVIPTYISKSFSKRILVLSGGGIRGISFIGALSALYDINILQTIEIFAGTSVGALILFLINIGYSPHDLYEFIKAIDLNKLKSISIPLFLNSFGLDSGDKIINALKKFMKLRKINYDITFEDLYNITKKTLFITSVNINEQHIEYFSHISHPKVSVLKTVRMSISIPFVFTPVNFNECMYVDGGCIDNFPLSLFRDRKEELIGIYIVDKNPIKNEINSFSEFTTQVIFSIINGITENSIKDYEENIIKIVIDNINTIDFDISAELKKYMYDAGYKSVGEFMDCNL